MSQVREQSRLTRAQKWVVALAALLLIMGLANLGRAAVALRYASFLPRLPMTVSWSYLIAAGCLWSVALVVCAAGLLRFRTWGRHATLVLATLYQAHGWVDRFVFDVSDYARQTRPRDALLTVVFLALVWGLLSLPAIRCTFDRVE